MRETRRVALQTAPERIDLMVRGEIFTQYRYGAGASPGFVALYAPDLRAVTRPGPTGAGLWLAHEAVNGIDCALERPEEAPAAAGRIVTLEMTARRGSQSVGFRQRCAWLDSEARLLLTDTRTVRVLPGPGTGHLLDLTIQVQAPEAGPVSFGPTPLGLLRLRAAGPLVAPLTGQIRNSRGDYGLEAVEGQRAAWCAAVGVVHGETVGFVLLDHPTNLRFPSLWRCLPDGTLSPTFAPEGLTLAPRETLTLRYRVLVHAGYVEQGWANERLTEFEREPLAEI